MKDKESFNNETERSLANNYWLCMQMCILLFFFLTLFVLLIYQLSSCSRLHEVHSIIVYFLRAIFILAPTSVYLHKSKMFNSFSLFFSSVEHL